MTSHEEKERPMASRTNGGALTGSPFQFEEMTRTERVTAAVRGEEVDRLPICFWHHFEPEGTGRKMAEATLKFFDETFDLDILKVMPDIPYPFAHKSIREPNDWRLLEPIDSTRSRFFQQRAESVRILRDEVGFDTPIIVTVFNPLCEAMYFAADRPLFLAHLQENPTILHEALSIIAENLRAHIADVIDAGADGVFFALQGCTRSIMTDEQYREFGRPYDLSALRGATNGWLNILHVHGERDLMFDQVLDYPVQVVNWSDRLAGPSLREARGLTNKCLMGGWHEFGPLSNGPADKILEEAQDAVAQTAGRKFILANGCSVPDDTDEKWLHVARDVVEQIELD
jgi:uroporphyrinogen decarboxylase